MAEAAAAPLFEAAIAPHRSLSRNGLFCVIAAISALSSLVTFISWRLGAWPVLVFSAPEVGAALLLLQWHVKNAARASEVLILTEAGLSVVRTGRRGRREEKVLPTAWLQAVLEERRARVPALWLVAHGVREEVGRALGEAEKRELAAALAGALHRLRYPLFDNAQLAPSSRIGSG